MSQITLASNAAGVAVFRVEAPGTNTNRTLTLPDQTGTLATTADATAAANTAVAAAEGMVVLGTLTMSGSSQSLPGLNLTSYKQLLFDFNGVSHNAGSNQNVSVGAGVVQTNITATDAANGQVWVSLWSGVATPLLSRGALPASFSNNQNAQTGYSNATTSVAVSISGGAFDAGSIRIYGVK